MNSMLRPTTLKINLFQSFNHLQIIPRIIKTKAQSTIIPSTPNYYYYMLYEN